MNEIDYILTSRRDLCQDVTVLNSFNTGSDHRLVRARIVLNAQLERVKLVQKRKMPDIVELKSEEEKY